MPPPREGQFCLDHDSWGHKLRAHWAGEADWACWPMHMSSRSDNQSGCAGLLAPGTSDSAQGVSGHPLWLWGSFTRGRHRCFQGSGVSRKTVVIFGPGIGSRGDFSYRGSLASAENLTRLTLYCAARKVAHTGPWKSWCV